MTRGGCETFFHDIGKILPISYFWVIWTCLATSIKNNVNLQKLWCLSACKKWTPSLTSFLSYCKLVTVSNVWLRQSIMIVSPCRKISCQKSWNHLAGNFDIYLYVKNQLHISLLSWEIVKPLHTCYFENFGNAWPSHQNSYNFAGNFHAYLHAEISSLSLTSFLGYCKEIANVLSWVIWACLVIHT